MNPGAITLKCPHCGGVFLTLQHGGIIETCPHCAVAAPRASFVTSSGPPAARLRTDLPAAKRETSLDHSPPKPEAAPIASEPESAGAILSAPVSEPHSADTIASANPPESETESQAAFKPESEVAPAANTPPPLTATAFMTSTVVPAAPTMQEIVPRAPQEPASSSPSTTAQNGATVEPDLKKPPEAFIAEPADRTEKNPAPPTEEPLLSGPPIFRSPSWPPPSALPAAFPLGTANGSPGAHHDPPVWPGLDIMEDVSGALQSKGTSALPGARRRRPWFTIVMLAVLIGSIAWLAFQSPRPVVIPEKIPPRAAKTAEATMPGETVTPSAPPTVAPATPPAPPPATPEVKPAVPNANPAEVAAVTARASAQHYVSITEDMVRGLDTAASDSERLRWVDVKESQRDDVKRFFETHPGGLNPGPLEPASGKVVLIPSGEEVQLFRLTTATCREGALLQVREVGGKAKLRWKLFEQFHEKTYDRFLEDHAKGGSGKARWFILLCQRAHSSELKDAAKDQWVCFDAQGSLSASGTGQVYVKKDSPVGRMLDAKSQGGRLYLMELLVGKMEVGGHRLNVVLDCAGTQDSTAQR